MDVLSMILFGIALAGYGMAASGPKKDKRFKSGYKDNELPNWKVKVTGGVVAVVFGILGFISFSASSGG